MNKSTKQDTLVRIAEALERIAPKPLQSYNFEEVDGFIWNPQSQTLKAVGSINRVDIDLLIGIDRTKQTLLSNTLNFAQGFSANNALLWGARGMGKSSLVKAIHQTVQKKVKELKLVEIHREDLNSLDQLLALIRNADYPFIVFCDDLSFSKDEHNYKTLKAALDGGVEGRPKNVLFYVTSNRRHLMPRDMIENERSTAINPSEAVEEKVSLSDRFGLWLGFHPCSQDQYIEIIQSYCSFFELKIDAQTLKQKAIEWQQTRGSRSGRVAWQFVLNLAGEHGINVEKILSKDN